MNLSISSFFARKKQKKAILADTNITSLIFRKYESCGKRLFLLDYDGTLIPFSDTPKDAIPDQTLIKTLTALTLDSRNTVAIVSGRSRVFLDFYFADMPLILIAEHGTFIKKIHASWEPAIDEEYPWKRSALYMAETARLMVPLSEIEEKESSVAWHYRKCDPGIAEINKNILIRSVLDSPIADQVRIIKGNKVIEIQEAKNNKGTAGLQIVNSNKFDFILCAGDDTTDEDLFAVLEEAFTIKIGKGGTVARYYMRTPEDFRTFLSQFSRLIV
jgi:trehalose 6-phosphate synthase/phosphatase